MTPQSAKGKGRRLQQYVRDLILSLLENKLEQDDVRSTSMGMTGEDVQLSPAARKILPIQIECKNKAKYAVYKDYKQAKEHGQHEPVLIIKQNGDKPLAVVDVEYLLKLIIWKSNTQ